MISILAHRLHCHCWGGASISVERHPRRGVQVMEATVRGSVVGENLSAPDTTTAPSGVHPPSVSSEPSSDGDLSAEENETSS